MNMLVAVAVASVSFLVGFMVCFIDFCDKSMKAQYRRVLDRNKELCDQLRWRRYPNERPEDGQLCLVDIDGTGFAIDEFSSEREWLHFTPQGLKVVHWLPFPGVRKIS